MERKGMSDMAGEATRVAVKELEKRAKTMERKGISDMAGEATRVAVRELGKRAKTMEQLGGAIPQLRDCEVTASDIGSERVSIKNLPRGRNRGIIKSLACVGSCNSHAEGQRKEGPP